MSYRRLVLIKVLTATTDDMHCEFFCSFYSISSFNAEIIWVLSQNTEKINSYFNDSKNGRFRWTWTIVALCFRANICYIYFKHSIDRSINETNNIFESAVRSVDSREKLPRPEILCFCVAFEIRIERKISDRPKGAQLLEICNGESTGCTWNAKKGL